jgi:hypothetical protein
VGTGHEPGWSGLGGIWTWKPSSHWQAWLWLALPAGVVIGLIGDAFDRSTLGAVLEGAVAMVVLGTALSLKIHHDRHIG